VIVEICFSESEPLEVIKESRIRLPLVSSASLLGDFENYREIRVIILGQEVFNALKRFAVKKSLALRILNTKIFEEEDMLFSKIAVLKISYYLVRSLESKASKLIG
jgi:hypothetical protein